MTGLPPKISRFHRKSPSERFGWWVKSTRQVVGYDVQGDTRACCRRGEVLQGGMYRTGTLPRAAFAGKRSWCCSRTGYREEKSAAVVEELKTESEEKRQHELDKRFPVAQECKVGRLIMEVDGDRTVLAGRCGSLSHGSPSVQMVVSADKTT